MLKFKNILSTEPVYNKSDFYVPINIKFCYSNIEDQEDNLYWRSGNFNNSLIEIGIGKISGKIQSITVVLVSKVSKNAKLFISKKTIEKTGLPVFDTTKWQGDEYADRFLEEVGEFEINIGQDDAFIIFSKNEIVLKVTNDRVVFGFDNNNQLCSIEVKNMNTEEKTILEESLSAIKQ